MNYFCLGSVLISLIASYIIILNELPGQFLRKYYFQATSLNLLIAILDFILKEYRKMNILGVFTGYIYTYLWFQLNETRENVRFYSSYISGIGVQLCRNEHEAKWKEGHIAHVRWAMGSLYFSIFLAWLKPGIIQEEKGETNIIFYNEKNWSKVGNILISDLCVRDDQCEELKAHNIIYVQ